MSEKQKRDTTTQAFCKVCGRGVDLPHVCPHEHDVKIIEYVTINPHKIGVV